MTNTQKPPKNTNPGGVVHESGSLLTSGMKRARRGTAGTLAASVALGGALVATGAAVAAPAAFAAPGDQCSVNFNIMQDVTWSFTDQNMQDASAQIASLVRSFEGESIPVVAGYGTFGQNSPNPFISDVINQDASTASGNDALTDVIEYVPDAFYTTGTDESLMSTYSVSRTNWSKGLLHAWENAQAQGSKDIIFVTDGVPNAWTDEDGNITGATQPAGNYDPLVIDQAAEHAGQVIAQIRDSGINVHVVFIRTDRPSGRGIDDPTHALPQDVYERAMNQLVPGWTIDDAVRIADLGDALRANALTGCTPAIELTKSHTAADITDVNGNGLTDAGDTVVYTFDVRNIGNINLTGVQVTDPILAAAGVTLENGGLIGDLLTESSAQIRSNPYTLTQADLEAGVFDNVADVIGYSPAGNPTDRDDDTVPLDQVPAISLEKFHNGTDITDVNGNGITDAGDTVVHTFVATNTGNVTLYDATISDDVLAAAGVSLADGGYLGTLAPGASGELRSNPYTFTVEDEIAGGFYNTATVVGTPPVGPPVTDEDDDTVPLTPHPAIDIVKSHTEADITDVNGNGFTDAGDTVVYTFDVTNTGTASLFDVVVTDPTLDSFGVALQNGGVIDGEMVPGASTSLLSEPYTLTQEDVNRGEFVNIAMVTGTDPEGTTVTDSDDDLVPTDQAPGIALVKSHTEADITDRNGNGLTDAGDTVVHTFDVTNTGNLPLYGVAVTDPILAEAGVELADGGVVGTVAPGATVSIKSEPYTLTQADVDNGGYYNVATVVGTPPAGPPVTDDDDDEVPTDQVPGVVLVKSHEATDITDVNGNGLTDAGDTAVFTFSATNTGTVTLHDVVVSDPTLEAAGVALVDGGAVGSLAAGQTGAVQSEPYTLTQADVDAGGFYNVATVVGTPPAGPPVTDDDDDEVPVNQVPEIGLVKTAAEVVDVNKNGHTDAGDQIIWQVVVSNTGTVTWTDGKLIDELLDTAGVKLVPGSEWTGTLAPGGEVTFTSEPYTITAEQEKAGKVVNVATVDAVGPNGEELTATDDAEVPTSTPSDPSRGAITGIGFDETNLVAIAAGVVLLIGAAVTVTLVRRRSHSHAE